MRAFLTVGLLLSLPALADPTTTTVAAPAKKSARALQQAQQKYEQRELAVVDDPARSLPLLPLVMPVQGAQKTPLSWPTFYRAVADEAHAVTAEDNDNLRAWVAWPLVVGGAAVVVAGVAVGAAITSGEGGLSSDGLRNAGLAVSVGGGVGAAAAVAGVVVAAVASDPVSVDERRALAGRYNATLRENLGLENSADPTANSKANPTTTP